MALDPSDISARLESIESSSFIQAIQSNANVTISPVFRDNMNTIVIVCNELIAYHNIPQTIRDQLIGYNAFKKLSIKFTNIHNNRTMCSPSNASLLTSKIDTGIQDDINQPYQYNAISKLGIEFDTIGKNMKGNSFDISGYFGKAFIDSKLASSSNVPLFNVNTSRSMREYGFDRFNLYGDSAYITNKAYFTDSRDYQSLMDSGINENDVDYINKITGDKYAGALPFLRARHSDRKSYHMQFHISSPNDTSYLWQNLSQTPQSSQLQYTVPFLKDQTVNAGYTNPYHYNDLFPEAYVQDAYLTENYFEQLYHDYLNTKHTLPFIDSYDIDYATNSNRNSIFPYFAASAENFSITTTFPNNSDDVQSWKNLINNYYGLIIKADNYIYNIYKFLDETRMLKDVSVIITSNHGNQMGAHGLKNSGFPFKESMNVPFLVYSPFLSDDLKNTTSNILGSLLDLAPTNGIIANLTIQSHRWLGQSLLDWDLKTKRLKLRTTGGNNNDGNLPVVNISNSWTLTSTYFSFDRWYKKQSSTTQNKIVIVPDTFFEYMSHYQVYIDKINYSYYKYIRFYTMREIIAYNIVYNDKLPTKITAEIIETYIPTYIKSSTLINYGSDIIALMNAVNSYVSTNKVTSFTFPDIFDHVKTIGTVNNLKNSVILTLLMLSLVSYVKSIIGTKLLLPGSALNFATVQSDPHYYTFGYNISDDPNELFNFLDVNYPDRQTTKIKTTFSQMNDNLNSTMKNTYKIDQFDYILPEKVLVGVLIGIKLYGPDLSSYSTAQLQQMSTYMGLSESNSQSTTDIMSMTT